MFVKILTTSATTSAEIFSKRGNRFKRVNAVMCLPRHQPVDDENCSSLWAIPSSFRAVYRFVNDYYTGDDLLPLSRQRHREQIIYYRKICTKMGILCLSLGIFVLVGTLRARKAEAMAAD